MTAKKKAEPPKPRHVWEINPRQRVKPSAKIYKRPEEKKKKKSWFDKISWFGD